jgi:hypothetical protein
MHCLSLLYLLLRLLHVSAFMCHLQGGSCILMSYLKGRNGYVVVMYCKCWWPVCTVCCSVVCYVVQLSSAGQRKARNYNNQCTQATNIYSTHSRRLRVANGAIAPGPALEGAPRFRPKVVLMRLSSYILR